jgi:hypothetical protein
MDSLKQVRPGCRKGGAPYGRLSLMAGVAVLGLTLAAVSVRGAEVAAPTAAETAEAAKKAEGAKKAVHPRPQEMEALAKRDPLQFLRVALKWSDDKITDYTCIFQKQERIDDELRKLETMRMKFRATAFGIYLRWVAEPSKGQEVLYVQGQNGNKAVVHPSGFLGVLFRKVLVDPTGKDALKHSRRPITVAGMANMLRVIIPQCEEAKTNGDLTLTFEGIREHDGRPTYVFKRTLPDKKNYPCAVLVIYVDKEYLACTRSDAFDWNGDLVSQYIYTDLVINPGLVDKDFDPANEDYTF